jgi:hypothetical protein
MDKFGQSVLLLSARKFKTEMTALAKYILGLFLIAFVLLLEFSGIVTFDIKHLFVALAPITGLFSLCILWIPLESLKGNIKYGKSFYDFVPQVSCFILQYLHYYYFGM